LTGESDATARLWDARTGKLVLRFDTDGPVFVARFSPDGKVVATGDDRGDVQLFRTRNAHLIGLGQQTGAVTDLAFSPDGKTIATAGAEGVGIWSVPEGRRRHLLESPTGVSRVAFSPDGSLVAAAGHDGTARVWTVTSGRLRRVLHVSKLPLSDVAFS